MRKIYFTLALLISGSFLKAQTGDAVNFTFVSNQLTNTVVFTNTTVLHGDGPHKAFWSFGDGSVRQTAPLANTDHHYALSGTYTVCLKIYKYNNTSNDSVLTGQECKMVALSTPNHADSCSSNFTMQPISATPFGRKFIAQPWHSNNKKPVRICWEFGDGKDTCIQYAATYSGDYWVEHKYTQYGQYEVCTTIKYDGGCEKRKCNLVNLAAPATDNCTFTLNESPVNLSSLERKFYVGLMANKRAEKVCWNFGDGSDTCITLSSPLNLQQLIVTHHYPSPGNYTVCAKVYYVGPCVVQHCKPVEIPAVHNNLCGGYMMDSLLASNTYRFKGTGVQSPTDYVLSYNWTFGDGASANGQTVNHSYTTPGNYNVCLTIKTNAGCETRICKRHIVPGVHVPQLILSPNPVANTLHAVFTSQRAENVTINIFNANGLQVRSYTKYAAAGINNWDFEVAALTTGIYSVIVQSPLQFATAIFFKQ